MSDGFDDLLGLSPLFSPTDPLSSLSFNDILGACDDHPLAGFDEQNFDFQEQNPVRKNCSSCGHHCILYGIKWRFAFAAIKKKTLQSVRVRNFILFIAY